MGKKKINTDSAEPVTLKVLAAHLKLDPATVSVVLNNVPGRSIPEATRNASAPLRKNLITSPASLPDRCAIVAR